MRKTLWVIFLLLWFTSPAYGGDMGVDITLEWDANGEEDVSSYRVYYKAGSGEPPYFGLGAMQGESPITVAAEEVTALDGETCRFTVRGLNGALTYYFAVTATNGDDVESAYSNEAVWRPLDAPWVSKIWPSETQPGDTMLIMGSFFGEAPEERYLCLGGRCLSPEAGRVVWWDDSIIAVVVPSYQCQWFRGQDSREINVSVEKRGVRSNKVPLNVTIPAACRVSLEFVDAQTQESFIVVAMESPEDGFSVPVADVYGVVGYVSAEDMAYLTDRTTP